MYTRALDTYIIVSKNAQKSLGDFTHPIGWTGSIQMMHLSSPGANGTTYANATTCDDVMVPQWYASVTSRLDTRNGPWDGSTTQTA